MGVLTFDELQEAIRARVERRARSGFAPNWWHSGRTLEAAFRGREDELAALYQLAADERRRREGGS